MVNILAADKLMNSPKLYATFLLWMLAELFEHLPEVGDPEKPKLVFFFDEAHLLFNEAPKALLEKIEQVVRLIRSKGVGVYFVTQNPLDIPESVLGQLGNRVQHALRAFTPKDQKAVKSAAETMRPNPKLKVEQVITELGVGEALVSFLDDKGRPCVVERAFIVPPGSQLGPISADERRKAIAASSIAGHYEKAVDRESAYEKLKGRTEEKHAEAAKPEAQSPESNVLTDVLFGKTGPRGGKQSQGLIEAMAKSAVRTDGLAGRPGNRPRRARLDPRQAALSTDAAYRFWGIAFALAGTVSFAFRPILIKLALSRRTRSAPTTLLFLRMTLSLPFFLAMAWWLRDQQPRARAARLARHRRPGLPRLLPREPARLPRPAVRAAGVGRLIMFLYPTLVLILSAVFLKKTPTRREIAALAITYAGIALVLSSQARHGAGAPRCSCSARC